MVSAKRRAIQVAGGWPEPDTMRIVTFPGTLVDVEVWSHPVVWGARMANQVHLRPVDSPLAEIARLGVELAGPRTEAVIVVDLDGRVVAWNNHATELFGWTAEEAIGRTTEEVMGRREDEAEMDEVARGLSQGESWTGVQTSPTKNGPDIDVRLTARFVRDWRDSPLGVVIMAHGVFTEPADGSALMIDLSAAIDDDQLVVHYQPHRAGRGQRRGEGRGAGALAAPRARPPAALAVHPAAPRARRSWPAISRKVLEIACAQVAEWRTDLLPALELAVNVSANELADPKLIDDVSAVLDATGLPPAGAVARGDRDLDRRRPAPRPAGARAPAGPRVPHRPRRLRDGLRQPRPAPPVPGAGPEDRPDVRGRR